MSMNDRLPDPAANARPPGRPRGVGNITKDELDAFIQRLEAGMQAAEKKNHFG